MALSPPAHLAEDLGHLEGTRGVHVGSDDGDAIVCLFGVAECERSLQVNLKPQETEAQSETVTKLFRSFVGISSTSTLPLNDLPLYQIGNEIVAMYLHLYLLQITMNLKLEPEHELDTRHTLLKQLPDKSSLCYLGILNKSVDIKPLYSVCVSCYYCNH